MKESSPCTRHKEMAAGGGRIASRFGHFVTDEIGICRYPLNMNLGRPRVSLDGVLPAGEPRFRSLSSCSLVNIPTELSHLQTTKLGF